MTTFSEEIVWVDDEYINKIWYEIKDITASIYRLDNKRSELNKLIIDRMNLFPPKPFIMTEGWDIIKDDPTIDITNWI